jgi:hypothetical protein
VGNKEPDERTCLDPINFGPSRTGAGTFSPCIVSNRFVNPGKGLNPLPGLWLRTQ